MSACGAPNQRGQRALFQVLTQNPIPVLQNRLVGSSGRRTFVRRRGAMKHSFPPTFLLALMLGACGVATSSRTFLSPSESGVASAHPPREAALEVNRLCELRGYALLDQHPTSGAETELKFWKLISPANLHSHEVSSLLYAWVRPAGAGSEIRMVGMAAIDGRQACTGAPDPSCTEQIPGAMQDTSGRLEASLIHGIVSELSLEGYGTELSAAQPSQAPSLVIDKQCLARRHEAFVRAANFADPAERAKVLKSAPQCDLVTN